MNHRSEAQAKFIERCILAALVVIFVVIPAIAIAGGSQPLP